MRVAPTRASGGLTLNITHGPLDSLNICAKVGMWAMVIVPSIGILTCGLSKIPSPTQRGLLTAQLLAGMALANNRATTMTNYFITLKGILASQKVTLPSYFPRPCLGWIAPFRQTPVPAPVFPPVYLLGRPRLELPGGSGGLQSISQ